MNNQHTTNNWQLQHATTPYNDQRTTDNRQRATNHEQQSTNNQHTINNNHAPSNYTLQHTHNKQQTIE